MDFNTMLHELAAARSRYEDLRSAGAPTGELVDARVGLLYLRAEIARARRGLV